MKVQEIKFQNLKKNYSILIGNNILTKLSNKIKILCPKTKNIAIFYDKKVPNNFKKVLIKNLKRYNLIFFAFNANEKLKSLKVANLIKLAPLKTPHSTISPLIFTIFL